MGSTWGWDYIRNGPEPFFFAIVMMMLKDNVRPEFPWIVMIADHIVIYGEISKQMEESVRRWR